MEAVLEKEHLEIMKHTLKNGRYCGDSAEMQELCQLGLMKSLGRCSFVPDEYFGITGEGKAAVAEARKGD